MMNLDLRQLRYFVTVAEELHFGRAARRLHMTQPPLSQTIQALEEVLGAPLFLRNPREVSLTPAGLALLPEARRMLAQAQELPALVQRAAKGEVGRLALAFVSSADYSVLPPFLRAYRAAYPHVQIGLQEATSDVQLDDLLHGRIDAGLLIPPLSDKAKIELDYLPVLSEPLILAAPAGLTGLATPATPATPLARAGKQRPARHGADGLHARSSAATVPEPPARDVSAQLAPVDLKTLPPLPLIIFPRAISPALHDAILSVFRAAGITPEIGQQAIQMQTIVGLVSAGMGIALVPQSVSNLMRPGVEYRALSQPTPLVETGLAWRRDNPSPVLAGFLALLRKNPVWL